MQTRLRVIAAIFSLACTGAALAQISSTPEQVFRPHWIRRPNGGDVVAHFPRRVAVALGVACCTPKDNGDLSCVVAMEWPRDSGIGAATLALSKKYRISPDSVAAFRAQHRDFYKLKIPFFMDPMSPEAEAALAAAQAVADRPEICTPSAPPTS